MLRIRQNRHSRPTPEVGDLQRYFIRPAPGVFHMSSLGGYNGDLLIVRGRACAGANSLRSWAEWPLGQLQLVPSVRNECRELAISWIGPGRNFSMKDSYLGCASMATRSAGTSPSNTGGLKAKSNDSQP